MKRHAGCPIGAVLFALLFCIISSRADQVTAILSLASPEGPTNNLEVTMTETAATFGSDTQVVAAAGSIPVRLDIFFDNATLEGLVTGIEFVDEGPNIVEFADVSFTNFSGLLTIDMLDLGGMADTPSPFSIVSGEAFEAGDHTFVFNTGTIEYNHGVTNDYAVTPLTNANASSQGRIALSLPVIDGTSVTYDVMLELPLGLSGNILSDSFFTVDMAVTGLLVASGPFSRMAPVPLVNNHTGATGVTTNAATLNGELVSTGASPTYVSVYWGSTDGGVEKDAWDQEEHFGIQGEGLLSTNIAGLLTGSPYFYRFYASNDFGEIWADASTVFSTPLDFSGFASSVKVMFNGYDGVGPLTNFPALVVLGESLTNFSYAQFARSEGGDLQFASGDRSALLNHEVDEWNTGGDSLVWVQVPRLDSNTSVYAYWGNPDETAFDPQDIPGLRLWLDAGDPASLTLDTNNRVSHWADISGLGADLEQADTNAQPLLVTNALNSRSILKFSADQWMLNSNILSKTLSGVTMVGVYKTAEFGGGDRAYGFGVSRIDARGTAPNLHVAGDSSLRLDNGSIPGSLIHPTGSVVRATMQDISTPYRYVDHINGMLNIDDAVTRTQWVEDVEFAVGDVRDLQTEDIEVAEVLVYDRPLGPGERVRLEQYLQDKWGLDDVAPPNAQPWLEGYAGVWHMSEPNARDSTENAFHGTAHGNISTPGCIGVAQEFNGIDTYVNAGGSEQGSALDLTERLTLSAWVLFEEDAANGRDIVNRDDDATNRQYNIHLTAQKAKIFLDKTTANGTSIVTTTNQTWRYVVATWDMDLDGGLVSLYVNGELENTVIRTNALPSFIQPVEMGRRGSGANYFDGAIDEVRISNVRRSPDWVRAVFLNTASNAAFTTYGAIETSAVFDADKDGILDAWEQQYFNSLTNATEISDWDGDGFIDLHEFRAGTNPTNSESWLKVDIHMAPGTGESVVEWSSVNGKRYDLLSTTNLNASWFILQSGIQADPPVNIFTNPSPGSPKGYFRIDVR